MQSNHSRSIFSTLRALLSREQDVRGQSTRKDRLASSCFVMESLEPRILLSATLTGVAPEVAAVETPAALVQMAAPTTALQVDLTGLAAAQVQTQSTVYGLDFPGSAAVPDGQTMRFEFDNPELNGLPIYGPNGQGVTYIWQVYIRQQSGYYTTFFWGNDNGGDNNTGFRWNDGLADTYYGTHPYPDTQPNGSTHKWEIALESNDFVNGTVVYDRWYTQALRVWEDASGNKHHEFYWDLPNTDAAHMVSHTSGSQWNNVNPPAPTLTWGDAPWNPGAEVMDGILRGIQIYATNLSVADIQSEIAAPMSTLAGESNIWYLNINPTPTDVSDKSGQGHDFTWVGNLRPTLYSLVVSQPPVAGNDSYALPLNTPLNVTGPGVLANDIDPDPGTTLTAVLTTGPTHGTLILNATGSFSYTPATGFVGLDAFTYQASDGANLSVAAIVTLAVGVSSNQLPNITSNGGAGASTVPVLENTLAVTTVTATDPDNDPLTYSLSGGVDQSKFAINPTSGVLTFRTAPNFEAPTDADTNNSYQVIVQVNDGRGGVDLQTLNVMVGNVNEIPVAATEAYLVPAGLPLVIVAPGVLINDTDQDSGSTLTAVLGITPANGTLVLNPNGSFSYTPNAGFLGIDTFTYRAYDGALFSTPTTVTLTVGVSSTGFTVSPPNMVYNGTLNGSNQVAGVTITNNNATSLTVRWSDSISWLIATSGDTVTIAPGASVTMTHTASVAGLSVGIYSGTATLIGGGVTKQVPVTLTVS